MVPPGKLHAGRWRCGDTCSVPVLQGLLLCQELHKPLIGVVGRGLEVTLTE